MYAEVAHLRYEEEQDRWIWEERRERQARRQRAADISPEPDRPTYKVVVTGTPIRLEFAEFQIMRLLARRPYHAYRTEEIVAAISAEGVEHITIENLRDVIVELRQKLGFFRDYIQSVPYIGYRFRP